MNHDEPAAGMRVNVRNTRLTGTRAPLPLERPTFRPYIWRDPSRRPDPRLLHLWDEQAPRHPIGLPIPATRPAVDAAASQ